MLVYSIKTLISLAKMYSVYIYIVVVFTDSILWGTLLLFSSFIFLNKSFKDLPFKILPSKNDKMQTHSALDFTTEYTTSYMQ